MVAGLRATRIYLIVNSREFYISLFGVHLSLLLFLNLGVNDSGDKMTDL